MPPRQALDCFRLVLFFWQGMEPGTIEYHEVWGTRYFAKYGCATFMTNEEAVKQVLSDYYNAFSTLDVQSILPYFDQPALLIGPLGVIAIPSPAAVVPIFGPVMEDLRQRKYHRSELSLQQFKLLSATSALAMGEAIRHMADGQELERVGVTYLMHKGNDGWKFAVMVLHDTDKVARRE
jgi:ketosteroid isomerase-like protein